MGRRTKISARLRSLFTFSKAEQRGILWLLPLLAIGAVVLAALNRPSFEDSFIQLADEKAGAGAETVDYRDDLPAAPEPELFSFDPNTVTLQELCRLGFTPRAAAGIIKYRERGKRFEIPEDFATCYGVTIEQYDRLEPYIVIGGQYRAQGQRNSALRSADASAQERAAQALRPFDPNQTDAEGFRALGFSAAQAAVIIRFRESMGGFATAADFGRCYVVSDEMFARLEPYIAIVAPQRETPVDEVRVATATRVEERPPVELNRADSASLLGVSGIGQVMVVRIMAYRSRLGGFHRKEQLAEIDGMTEANYERICEQISVDSCEIRKIDINFASHENLVERLGGHPYMTDKMLRRLLKQRQLKGGWSTVEDMVKENIMDRTQAARLAPYLIFN